MNKGENLKTVKHSVSKNLSGWVNLILASALMLLLALADVTAAEVNPLLWDRDWGEYSTNEAPHDISPDGQGNLYAIINSRPRGGGELTANLIKFDKDGLEQWHVELGRVFSYTYTLAADKTGNVYVYDGELRKYDPSGNLLWTVEHGSSLESAFVAVDPKGETVYVTAGINLGTLLQPDWAVTLTKFNKDGAKEWTRSIDTAGNETATAVAAGLKEVYVTGKTNGSFPGYTFSGNGMDGFLARISPDGAVDWIKQQNGLYFTDLAVDMRGSAYTTQTELYNGFPVQTSAARFEKDSKCHLKILLQFIPSQHTGIAVDAMGTIYVSGAVPNSNHPNFPDLQIEKYNSLGAIQFIKRIDLGIGPFAVRVGDVGDIFTAYYREHGNNYNFQAHVVKYEGDLVDTDGDGMPDKWEKNGVWVGNTFVDLPAMGADPNRKDVFVQVDWMGALKVEPKGGAFDKIIETFKNAPVDNPDGSKGINLHIDAGRSSIMNPNTGEPWGNLSKAHEVPYKEFLGSNSWLGNYQWGEFDEIKEKNFDPSRHPIFHYCVFANMLGDSGTTGGISRDIGASDFIVSLGAWSGNTGGTALEQGGTFMHELGHNLGLRHGGQDDIQWKPNYLSVMNYSFQTPGLTKKNNVGQFVNGNYDYSIFELQYLNEQSLYEEMGLSCPSGGDESCNPLLLENYGTTYYWLSDPYSLLTAHTVNAEGSRPIDWNWDGVTSTDPVSDALYIAAGPRGDSLHDTMVLVSVEDWTNLKYKGGSIGALGAEAPDETPLNEMTWEDEEALTKLYWVIVKAPANSGIKPGGSSVNYTFTVTNGGIKADVYTIEATSSAGWADLSSVPASVSLQPGESINISISVSVPPSPGDKDEIMLKAVSQTSSNIWDSNSVVTVLQPESMGTEQQITSYGAGTDNNIFGAAIYGDWVVWVLRQQAYSGPILYYAHNLATGEDRQIASVDLPFTPGVDIYGSKVVYQSDGGKIGVYDLSTGSDTQISLAPGVTYGAPMIYQDKVVYSSGGDIYLYDLGTNTERIILSPVDYDIYLQGSRYYAEYRMGGDYGGGIFGNRVVAIQVASPGYGNYYNVVAYDFVTDTFYQITADRQYRKYHVGIDGDRIVWEDNRTNCWNVYMYDLDTNIQSPVTTYSENQSYLYEHWPVINGNSVLLKKSNYQVNPHTDDLFMFDLNDGTSKLLAPNVYYGSTITYRPLTLAFDGRRVVYSRSNPTNLYMLTLNAAPETSLSTNPASPGTEGWFTTTPEITLTPDKEDVKTFYQWDSNSDLGWTGYAGHFTEPEGEHTLYYYSADDLGNTESVKTHVFRVDITPPETTVSTLPALGQTFGVIPQITLGTGETGSVTHYRWDGGSWNIYAGTFAGIGGEHTLEYYSVDSHGNTEQIKSRPFTVDLTADTTPPVTTLTVDPPLGASEEFYASSPVITLSVNEQAVTYYSWDAPMTGIPAKVTLPSMVDFDTYGAPIGSPALYWGKIPAPVGQHTLYYFSVDPSGNIERVKSRQFNVGSQNAGALSITTISLPNGTVGTAYSQTFCAAGGSGSYSWSVVAGSLPSGISLNPSTGTISGTPAMAGTFIFTIQVNDGTDTNTKGFSITVGTGASNTYSIAVNVNPLAGGGASGGGTYNQGATVTLTAIPSNGYSFVNWTGNNGFVTTSANPLTIINVTSDYAITANFNANPINGTCASSNGQTLVSAPTTNLCSAGTASTVSGNGHPWSWTCAGLNGGTASSCSANLRTTPTVATVPTMTEWGMIIFTIVAGVVAVYQLNGRRRRI